MTLYRFLFSSVGHSAQLTSPLDYPGIADALIAANFTARKLVSQQQRRLAKAYGRIDVVDESNAPLARIFLSDVARQMS